ncbi:hypothetical protein PpBr36_00147 [Pyricularia pennisetigena]|uniref:hypothetical protein n=1 Tax=Pyricularia pennisetigena TaxID=1578925 RepID=UPI00114EED52|nr:hypothetical protein PpBr36_00147 [Pyricularia pennisetigena]TLS29304.1 hypothetical protein PpBr36_00147 [Pyricularia pennisetigena]
MYEVSTSIALSALLNRKSYLVLRLKIVGRTKELSQVDTNTLTTSTFATLLSHCLSFTLAHTH